ncbi:polysaccharide deacetylase family protein [Glycomyces arizonensis]|uniref:polysaccharide deacetylase family protein n=1 Tax=Glycomyces arizonensis TaxID=256035 RepID=UPI00041B9FFD|nr:polysaccharide deacetylase family protein [Glycomyces arizonensis]
MRRFKVRIGIGIGVAAVTLVLLAWAWPDGTDPGGHSPGDPAASVSPSIAGAPAAEPSHDEDTESPSPSPSPSPEPSLTERSAEPEITAEPDDPARDVYGGPMGTRNHTGSDAVALTFDDGPNPDWTPKVLGELRERGVKATFCVIGAYAEAYPDLIADIVHDGHTLCSHSWYHEMDLGQRSEEEIRANLQRTNDAIEKAAPGAEVEYFRQPGGKWTDRVIRVAADMGMESLHWAVDPSDWDHDTTEAQIRDRVLDHAEPGSVVLLHDGASNQRRMLGALRSILDEFEDRGYTLTAL